METGGQAADTRAMIAAAACRLASGGRARLVDGRPACTDSSAPALSIGENVDATPGLAPTSTNGFRDRVIAGVASRDDGAPSARAPLRCTAKFDGRADRLDGMQAARAAWRR